jgi:hypothetical protein
MGVPRGELRLPLMAWSASEPRTGTMKSVSGGGMELNNAIGDN